MEASRHLAEATPHGEFTVIPDRHHFNAPGSRVFRSEAVAYLTEAASGRIPQAE